MSFYHVRTRLLGAAAFVAALSACVPAGMAPTRSVPTIGPGVVPPSASPAPGAGPAAAPPWFVPPTGRDLQLVQEAGVEPLPQESVIYHIHAYLQVWWNGAPVVVPANVGIARPDAQLFWISELHTHATDGILHVEAPERKVVRLKQFFQEWDVPLGGATVYDGGKVSAEGGELALHDQQAIAVVYGTPPARIQDRWPYPVETQPLAVTTPLPSGMRTPTPGASGPAAN